MLLSKKHPIRYYAALYVAFVLWAFIPIATVRLLFSLYQTDARSAIALGVIFSIFFLPITLFIISKIYGDFMKYASVIKMDNEQITFDKAIYPLSEIQFISLTGKPPLGKHKTMLEEAAVIKFRNGDLHYIFDKVHTNSWKLKQALEQVLIKNTPIQISKIEQKKAGEVSTEESQKFAGSQWSSFDGIMLWGVVGFFTFLGIFFGGEAVWLFVLSFIIFWYLFLGNQMNYFAITEDNYLIIRNHIFPFRKYAIRLSDIREVTFEIPYRMPICLRVITKDFRSKSFPASTLRTRHWFDLKIALEEHEIFVRNECVQDFDWDLETIEKTSYD